MLESSAHKILVVDHSKFSRRALHALGPVTDFDLVIIDDATPPEIREQLRARGVELEVVPLLTVSAASPSGAAPTTEPTRLERGLQPTG
jgi:hypothetical protein